MSLLKSEPVAGVTSMEELVAIAYAMEQEAIAGYSELAQRMRDAGRPEMVAVFERLIEEETGHLGSVVQWSRDVSGGPPDISRLRWEPEDTFDDEGAATVAPELLSPYKALATAVRNEERAFLFWTYVASQSAQESLRKAAEGMAREELGHLTTLRRERRRAFHQERATASRLPKLDVAALERRLAALLSGMEVSGNEEADVLRELAGAASRRGEDLERRPLGASPLLSDGVADDVLDRPVPLSELLLDCYLDYSERLPGETDRQRAQKLAAEAVECRAVFRRSRSR